MILLMLGGGCGPTAPKTIKVKGMVTYNGEKLKQGMISFSPTSINPGEPMRPVAVNLDAEGNFTLSTFTPGDGILPGEYAVTIISYEVPPSLGAIGKEVWAIPRKYGDPQLSGLKAVIKEDDHEPLELDFDLTGEKNK